MAAKGNPKYEFAAGGEQRRRGAALDRSAKFGKFKSLREWRGKMGNNELWERTNTQEQKENTHKSITTEP